MAVTNGFAMSHGSVARMRFPSSMRCIMALPQSFVAGTP